MDQNELKHSASEATNSFPASYLEFYLPFKNMKNVTSWISESLEDSLWNNFLTSTNLGQFQQSTYWAKVKRLEDWSPIRFVIIRKRQIIGGFQMLIRQSRWGCIGYISKGPVLFPYTEELAVYVTQLIVEVAKQRKLRAIITQPPDECAQLLPVLIDHGFKKNYIIDVIDATLCVDITSGVEALRKGINNKTRTQINKMLRAGVTLREGSDSDIAKFFKLMKMSCERQGGVKPNPPTEEVFRELWRVFHSAGHSKIFLSEYQGTVIGAALCIMFGGRVTFWKLGWDYKTCKFSPIKLIALEAMNWGSQHGYSYFDFAGIPRKFAEKILENNTLNEQLKRHRDFFKFKFGGKPKLLPQSLIYFPNPIFKGIYQFSYSFLSYIKSCGILK
jgi:lipid II:glycine glycyltransferase (peptidoglycan interpeptide bridge formation enzyme)